ncbi:MAG TPA: hypothetical protein VIC87_05505 [Vicinamibacteria bacterium]
MRRARPLAAVLVALLAACGTDDEPTDATPVPPVTAAINGNYTLILQTGPGCPAPGGPYQIQMQATQITSGTRTELQANLPGGDPQVAVTMLFTSPGQLRGSLGTQFDRAVKNGYFVWFRMIGTGTVSRATDGRGEVVNGTMQGDLSVTPPTGVPVDCVGASHLWSLRIR